MNGKLIPAYTIQKTPPNGGVFCIVTRLRLN
jgi:hypothetical protein